ncbi:hypothetical protein FIBSPDRAFT_940040 [Athelia psychrophila]|uniref:Uncharacterized protein n=1 Tax=Athelia psychrophila TaxID=1759441 RepID=A0A167WQE4_9AGAM|nr:hypothetical protein FIBSPDRAFT_940040 [Fibularhizoctonia sp. CBS 109695]
MAIADSDSDQQFLVKPFIGTGKVFADLPASIQTAFKNLTTVPSVIETIILPRHDMSVLQLIKHPLPPICLVTPSPGPASLYFFKDEPAPLGAETTRLLKTLSVPTFLRTSDLLASAGQRWLDGYQSIAYVHTSDTTRFPLWILRLWRQILDITAAQKTWADADRYLSGLQLKNKLEIRVQADNFRILLSNLPWHGRVKGFSDNEDVTYLAAFASTRWLSDIHETFMLECIQRHIRASPDYDAKKLLTSIWTSQKIITAYNNRTRHTYPPSTPDPLAQLGNDLASGIKTKLGMMWFINDGHWASTDISVNNSQCTIAYADPERQALPESVRAPVNWWLAAHLKHSLSWATLECALQRDGYSCGILANNALAHDVLPEMYPLIDTSVFGAVVIARLKAGAEVIQHHCLMVLNIARGLERIGKTRFATICLSAISLERCTPAITKMTEDENFQLQESIHRLFVKDSYAADTFTMGLKRLIKVLKPFAKTIASLESSQANPADVYLFWLAILANLKRVLDSGDTGFSAGEAGQIRAVANEPFRELLQEGPTDCYISVFYLDPRYVHSKVLKKLNPLELTISIPAQHPGSSHTPGTKIPSQAAYSRVLKYIGSLHSSDVKAAIKSQFYSYSLLRFPFDKPLMEGQTCIGKKLYSIKPNSMPEERVVSVFTRMNSGPRNAQEVRTLVDMTQIRQYEMYIQKPEINYEHPTVDFCDLDQELFDQPGTPTSTGEKTAKRKFQTSSLLVDDDHHDGEGIGENTREWMDDELVGVVPQPNFSTVEQDADLDASELEDLLADRPRKDKGKGRAQEPDRIEETTDDEHSDEDDWDLA